MDPSLGKKCKLSIGVNYKGNMNKSNTQTPPPPFVTISISNKKKGGTFFKHLI